MIEQDWIWGLLGGLLIGAGGAVYLLGNGRIMGASGIVGGLVDGTGRSTAAERIVFLVALAVTPMLLLPLAAPGVSTHLTGNWVVIVAAGLLVGIGTRIANGCTSGHGVCGISRLSPRGIAATLTFLTAGAVAMLVFRHLLGVI